MSTKSGHEMSEFSVAIPDQDLVDLKDRLRRTRLPEDFGKPSSIILDTALAMLGLRAGDCVMVGDRLQTDIAMALDAGAVAAPVLVGDSTREDVAAVAVERRPTFVLERIDELPPPGSWRG